MAIHNPRSFNQMATVMSKGLARTSLATPSRSLAAARTVSPIQSAIASLIPANRTFSTAFSITSRLPPLRTSSIGLLQQQQRNIFGASFGSQPDHNALARMEHHANNNQTSASAQNAFYEMLLRANMPHIVVERYNDGRYATNAATDRAYHKALQLVPGGVAANNARVNNTNGNNAGYALNNNGYTRQEMQAVGQAIGARQNGGNISMIAPSGGSGGKMEPLYVVVDESWSSAIFKWVKFTLVFGAVVYIGLIVMTLLVEGAGMLKKVGASQAKEAEAELQKARFSDVHGCEEAKEELQELVEFLKNPEQFSTLGGKLPKGVLLAGPPGTGKTLLARAVAGEAGVPFFYMSGSEFDEIYVGVGAKRVRELFASARAKSPAIIFIDELDAIGGKRNERDASYSKQTLNQLLTELDGFEQDTGVIIIGATNFPSSLDKALTRPGRFDRNVAVSLPDVRGRIAILKHHMQKIKTDASVDAAEIARGSPGFSGADLENVVNQAAVRASKNKQAKVTIKDLVWAKDKIMMGAERRSAVIQQKDKVMTAYHEGGHALVAMLTEGSMPLYKATIMPRGQALGITHMLPEMDKVSETKKELMARIDVSMGGKVAEELIYGAENVTTGASSDISNATAVAYMMVTQAGMSDKLGNIDLQSDYARLSPQTKQTIEAEVRKLVEDGRARATKLLTDNREALARLANALVEYETLDRAEMEKVVKGEKLSSLKMKVDPDTPVKLPEPGTTMKPASRPGLVGEGGGAGISSGGISPPTVGGEKGRS